VTLLDIALRLRDLQAFYGDQGVLSRSLYFTQSWEYPGYTLFLASGSSAGLLALFGLWAVMAACLTIGYQSRLAGLVTWFFVANIQLRNPMVMDGGDDLLRVMLFWTPFLPVGARWSVDARRHPEWTRLPVAYRSVATAGLTLQLFVLYFFAALLKTGASWWKTGDALYYTLSIDQFTTPLGHWLLEHPQLLRPMTFGALTIEYSLAALLVLGGLFAWARVAFYVLAVAFHLSIAAMLELGVFMPIAIACLTVMLPTWLLDRCSPRAAPAGTPAELPSGYRLGAPLRLLAGFMTLMIAIYNGYSIGHHQKIPPWSVLISELTFEQQHWHFFAPEPGKNDGWYKLEVTLKDGDVVDALRAGPEVGGKPVNGADQFPNQRWRRWMQNLVDIDMADNQSWRRSTLIFLARRWLAEHPKEVPTGFRLVLMHETTPPPGGKTRVDRVVLAELTVSDLRSGLDKASRP
jgi:hypothetical protein